MMTALVALALGITVAGAAPTTSIPGQEPGSEPLASLTMAGRLVSVKTPPPEVRETESAYIPWEGWNYQVSPDGRILGRWKQPNRWAEVAERFRESRSKLNPTAKPWRTRVIVFTRSDVLERRADGVLHQSRVGLETRGLNDVLQQIGLFKLLADAESDGVREVQLQVEIEQEPIRVDLTSGEDPMEILRAYLRPRSNVAEFDTDSAIFGPYDSVFVIHPLFVPPTEISLHPGGIAARVLPYYPLAERRSGVVDALHQGWLSDVASARWRQGHATPERPVELASLATREEWASLTRQGPIDRAAYAAHRSQGAAPGSNALGFDPAYAAFVRAHVSDPSLILGMHAGKLWVRSDSENPLSTLGWEGKIIGAFRSGATAMPFDLLGSPVTSTNVTARIDGGSLAYTEEGGARHGGATIAAGLPTEAQRYLLFRARTGDREPVAIHVQIGAQAKSYVFGRDLPSLSQNWADYVIALPVGTTEVRIGAPTDVRDRIQIGQITVEFDRLRIEDSGMPSAAPAQPQASVEGTPAQRALFAAANPPTLALLRDSDATVQLNALKRAAEAPQAEFLEALAQAGRSVNYWVAKLAIDGIAKLDSSPARATLGDIAVSGALEINRALAASKLEPAFGSSSQISQLFAAKNWQARQLAAQSLGRYRSAQDQTILMAFLLDVDPLVRLTVVQAGDLENDVVLRRLEWASVNDPSEVVRAAALARLMGAKDARLQRAGDNGVKDDSPAVRLAAVQAAKAQSRRQPLLIAVTDEDPYVKAEALRALAALPNPITPEEVSTALNDLHPVVQRAVLEVASANRLTVPEEARARLKASVDPEVAKRAREVFGGE